MTRPAYAVASLPEVDAVDIVLVDREYETVPRKAAIPGTTLARLEGEAARRAAALWRGLPEAEQSRCHLPRYGLRFYCSGALHLEAALCFECDNISIIASGAHEWATFDGKAAASRELLALMRSHDPSSVSGEVE